VVNFPTVAAPDMAGMDSGARDADAVDRADDVTASPPVVAPERVGWVRGDRPVDLLAKEWLIANGLGGYASGSLAGTPTRRFHGLLVASLPAPLGRTMMLNHVIEVVTLADGTRISLSGMEPAQAGSSFEVPVVPDALALFRLVNGRPVWRFEQHGIVLEKSLLMPHGQNSTLVRYQLLSAPGPVTLSLEPLLDVRPHEGPVVGGPGDYTIEGHGPEFTITDGGAAGAKYPPLHLRLEGGTVQLVEGRRAIPLRYRIEQGRGYDWHGDVHSAGRFQVKLSPDGEVRFMVSTESWEQIRAVPSPAAHMMDDQRRLRLLAQARPEVRHGLGAELVLAADQFIVKPHARPRDEAVLSAQGEGACTVIAGYPWFTDWGRDTMISLEGLTLATGRVGEARDIIHTFAHHIRDGLIPNLFPEGKNEGLYHTSDATLWFFHAIDRYEVASGDTETRRFLLPKLAGIIEKHIDGTRFGIGVDSTDGLLHQGAPGYQLTWMDAKVGDWVVTPRRGKAVEINALFYNALCLMERWLREAEGDGWAKERGIALHADEVAARAAALHTSFNQRFWYPAGNYLYDVIDGEAGEHHDRDDSSLRPNQLLAIALPHPVLDRARWEPVLRVVADKLATPFGLRSLAPGHADYKPRYDGDLRARDAAYHQGTVWGWLVGPFVDAWLKTYPEDPAGARRLLDGLETEMGKFCIGTISEICDAEPPFTPRGCAAQAWSVAEALRALALIAKCAPTPTPTPEG
jgi:predicted glycogen debranching enzyme